MTLFAASVLRSGRDGPRAVRVDLCWLIGLTLLLVATGIGLRDPWPADEPRFTLIARDMIASGNWLIPQVGGDLYADKPPLYFWLLAAAMKLTGLPKLAFLLPSFMAAAGCVVLVYDLARRLWNRETALAAGFALLATAQFLWQARQAQIDATLCFWTTLGLYGLLRHLLLGPAWRWWAIGWAAAGFGIITKGIGFLPLLVLIPYALARGRAWHPRPEVAWGWRWAVGPVAFIGAIATWLAPMLIAASSDPQLAHYRDEILFRQTVDRYAQAWHHREPFWYFPVEVIPVLWLPLTALVPWLWGHWRQSLRERDLRVMLPLAWVVLVVLFFSLSSGKRGIYVLPAVPAFVLACAPYLSAIVERLAARRVLLAIASLVSVTTVLAAAYLMFVPERRQDLTEMYGLQVVGPLLAIGVPVGLVCLWARARHAVLAYGAFVAIALLVVSYWLNPAMNDVRSGKYFVREVEALTTGIPELGLVGYKEQYLLQLARSSTNFGHARWAEGRREAADAAAWLVARQGRTLLMSQAMRDFCFKDSNAREVGTANREHWYLISGSADPACVKEGHPVVARHYSPPALQTSAQFAGE
jgi:4-amino-4-deoxy-L-arabinose transferase-like glycosyltransferase